MLLAAPAEGRGQRTWRARVRVEGGLPPEGTPQPANANANAAPRNEASADHARLVAAVTQRSDHALGMLVPARLEHELDRRLAHVQVEPFAHV
jgi:hypothetical protein